MYVRLPQIFAAA